VAVIIALYEEMHSIQFDIIRSMSDLARSKLAAGAAEKLSQTLKGSLSDEIDLVIAKWNSLLLLRLHKLTLIDDACGTIQYLNHGKAELFCEDLKQRPDRDLIKVISYNFEKDMCQGGVTEAKTVSIPGMVRRGNESIPDGVIDLSSFYGGLGKEEMTEGSILFQIPDSQWLVQNGWILGIDVHDGPFFVKVNNMIRGTMLENDITN
jgi:hypothetical protein